MAQKLLEFRPRHGNTGTEKVVTANSTSSPVRDIMEEYEASLREDINDCVEQDVWMNLTDDLPRLRFDGPQMVFIWDDMKDRIKLEDLDIDLNKDFIVKHWNAYTVKHYLPFRNVQVNNKTFRQYVPRGVNWPNLMSQSVPDKFQAEPRPIEGRIYSMSLKAIQALDQNYGHGYTHSRVKVPVRTGMTSESPVIDCWLYFTALKGISKYDAHEQQYVMNKDITVGNLSTSLMGGKQNYHVPSYLVG